MGDVWNMVGYVMQQLQYWMTSANPAQVLQQCSDLLNVSATAIRGDTEVDTVQAQLALPRLLKHVREDETTRRRLVVESNVASERIKGQTPQI